MCMLRMEKEGFLELNQIFVGKISFETKIYLFICILLLISHNTQCPFLWIRVQIFGKTAKSKISL